MLGGVAGVRDEVGFLLVHQRYADRFFPGTSVLHTRLRYALLIPWIYADLRAARPAPRDERLAFDRMEHELTRRLREKEKDGVIGGDVYPDPSSQPASYVYWTALAKWGLMGHRPDGRPWSRADMARLMPVVRARSLRDDDGRPLELAAWPFSSMIEPGRDWAGDGPLSLALDRREARYLAAKLRDVMSPANPVERSLLSRLVGHSLGHAAHCWHGSIVALAGSEAAALRRAGQAAALAAVGRAIYAAQVETLKDKHDKRATSSRNRDALAPALDSWSRRAAALDESALLADVDAPPLPGPVRAVLLETLAWLRAGKHDPMLLLEPYARAEKSRKDRRARLAEAQFGVDRRLEWDGDKHGPAEPLHYRWRNVKRLLHDLEGVA